MLNELKEKRTTSFFDNIVTELIKEKYFYESSNHNFLTKKMHYTSVGDSITTKSFYPQDKPQLVGLSDVAKKAIDSLISQHRVSIPIQSESYKNGNLLSKQRTNYKDWGNGNILPELIQTTKGTSSLEDRIVFQDYYDNGNLKEVSKKDGSSIVYIWGYNQTQPIAKIENATSTDIPQNVYTDIVDASNADINETTENTLRTQLAKLRNTGVCPNLSDAIITTFTYDPLIGVTSVTDPRSRVMYYLYNSFNRLQYVKDHEGNILSENQYNYKN
jgi:hypothetical protein